MYEIVNRDEIITREEWDRDEAVLHYKKIYEPFKVELVETIPPGETISFYRQGKFLDLCRSPHMPSTKYTGHAFKLMNVAGAYWRGDSNRPQLQRIYGTAWPDQKQSRLFAHARGSGKAGPSQAWSRPQSLPYPGRGRRFRFLASLWMGMTADRKSCPPKT